MRIEFSDEGRREFLSLDKQLQLFFKKHMEKLKAMPPRRHMQLGLPFNVENVTDQARFTYEIQNDILYVVRCFAKHKDYERWYKSFG